MISVDRLHALSEFTGDSVVHEKSNFLCSGVAKRRHHQTTGPRPSNLNQLLRVGSLRALPEFGADPFVLKKKHFFVLVWLQRGGITRRRVHRQAYSANW